LKKLLSVSTFFKDKEVDLMPRTRSRSKRFKKIENVDTSYYIGYCEDEETPHAIMQKFAALERIQNQFQKEKCREQGVESDGEEKEPQQKLPDKFLKQLFQETTMFAVDDVIEARPEYSEHYLIDEYGFWCHSDSITDIVSEWLENNSEFSEDDAKTSKRKSKGRPSRIKLTSFNYNNNSLSVGPRFNPLHRGYNEKFVEVRYQRCPPLPLVPSYCHMIMPYKEPVPTVFPEADIFHDDLTTLINGNKVFGIYLNLPWIYHDADQKRTKDLWRGFQKIEYPDNLIKVGLVFVYIPKFLFANAVKVMKSKGFKWVEQAMVIPRDFGRIVIKKAKYIKVGKMCMHIFRKMKKGQLPMQHQRVTNLHLLSGEDKMHYTYNLIEQMLPPKLDNQANVRLLELYDIGEKREGWIQIRHKERMDSDPS